VAVAPPARWPKILLLWPGQPVRAARLRRKIAMQGGNPPARFARTRSRAHLRASTAEGVFRMTAIARAATRSSHVSAGTARYLDTLAHLSDSSVRKFYLPFRDIDWDAPEHQIDPSDVRFSLRSDSALGASSWYRGLPPDRRGRLGLDMMTQTLKFGIAFEAGLSRGLLDFVYTLPNRSREYRYAMHELIEECHHSLMFQEFIDRSGTDPIAIPPLMAFIDRQIARCGESFPEFFFACTLAGEIFIDDENRANLRGGDAVHPLARRIMQIHVTEEARHLHFAESFLRERMPRITPLKRRFLHAVMPRILRDAQSLMLVPIGRLAKRHGIPREVMRAAFGRGSAHRARVEAIARPVFELIGAPEGRLFPQG
jgi:hypothetical protein